MSVLNIAGYKFVALQDSQYLKANLLQKAQELHLKGTILLSTEGINLSLAGNTQSINIFLQHLKQDTRFNDMTFRESHSPTIPFKRLKVKVKKEIITLGVDTIKPLEHRAEAIQPEVLKQWLDEKREFLLLDTRNEYEIDYGTFTQATHLNLNDFQEFSEKAKTIPHNDQPVIMFCTGGIRCEKAGLHLLNLGFPKVYQLEGGILNYFAKVRGSHYQGDCFVFDERIALTPALSPTMANFNVNLHKGKNMGLEHVEAGRAIPNDINVIIEIPSRSDPIKYEVDKKTGVIMVDRFVATCMHYPCDYGFVPHTLSEDGDPLDVLVVAPFSLTPGVVIRCRPIGVLRMTDESGPDAKILAVPIDKLTTRYSHIQKPEDLGEELLSAIGHFFQHYKDLEPGKWVKLDKWENAESAKQEILDGITRYKEELATLN